MTTRTCVTCIYKSGSQCTKQWRQEPSIDPVTGQKRRGEHFYCSTQRQFESGSCGASGRWWKPINEQTIAQHRSDVDNGPNIFSRFIRYVLGMFF